MGQYPNILLLWTDEQRADTLAAYGNDRIRMPNLDTLAAGSAVFRNAYCVQPVCTPSRGTVMTGLWPHAHGCWTNNIPLDESVPCLPRLLPEGVYETAYVGKWHLGDELFAQHGWRHWVSVEDYYNRHFRPGRDRLRRSDYYHFLRRRGYTHAYDPVFSRGFACRLPESHSKPAFEADASIRFLNENRGRPWCLSVNTLEPHMPFHSCRDGQYCPEEVTLCPSHGDRFGEDRLLRHRLVHARQAGPGRWPFRLEDPDQMRRCLANYWGLCSLVDTHFGRILDALRATGQYDNTLIVFTSDHGDMMGGYGMVGKSVMYEGCLRVPLTVKLPGQTCGHAVEEPISQIDLLPTMLQAAGVDVPDSLQGVARAAVCEGGGMPAEDVVVEWIGGAADGDDEAAAGGAAVPPHMAAEWTAERIDAGRRQSARTLRTPDGWLYTTADNAERELFDLNSDPHQRVNLAGRPEHAERIAGFRARLRAWQRSSGDPLALADE